MIFSLAVLTAPLINAVCANRVRHFAENIKGSRDFPSSYLDSVTQQTKVDQTLQALAAFALAVNPVVLSSRVGSSKLDKWTNFAKSHSRHVPPRCDFYKQDLRKVPSADFDIELKKPFGIKFMMNPGANGNKVGELQAGSAKESTYVWKGDILLELNGFDITTATPEQAQAALIIAPDTSQFKFRRYGLYGCVDFPDGKRTFGLPGEGWKEIVNRAAYTGTTFKCSEGKCGSCDMYLRNADTGDVAPIRMCINKLEAASPEAAPWEVLKKNHPDAIAAKRKMDARIKSLAK